MTLPKAKVAISNTDPFSMGFTAYVKQGDGYRGTATPEDRAPASAVTAEPESMWWHGSCRGGMVLAHPMPALEFSGGCDAGVGAQDQAGAAVGLEAPPLSENTAAGWSRVAFCGHPVGDLQHNSFLSSGPPTVLRSTFVWVRKGSPYSGRRRPAPAGSLPWGAQVRSPLQAGVLQ